jgi:hypothetical protein
MQAGQGSGKPLKGGVAHTTFIAYIPGLLNPRDLAMHDLSASITIINPFHSLLKSVEPQFGQVSASSGTIILQFLQAL